MTIPFSRTLVIHSRGRKQENLVFFLRAILQMADILVVENLAEGLEHIQNSDPELILINDFCLLEDLICFTKKIHHENPQSRIVLMLPHPQENYPYMDVEADGILYDGFSPQMLKEMLVRFSFSGEEMIRPTNTTR
jgi:DNA-binding NarL/FixJ family response regulator